MSKETIPIFCCLFLKKMLQDSLFLDLFLQFLTDPLHHLPRGFVLPNAIAAHQNEIYFVVLQFYYVGVCWDGLLLLRERRFLESWVPKSPRKIQISINTTIAHLPLCLSNPLEFFGIGRLVIVTQLETLTRHTCHSSAVPWIRTVNIFGSDKNYVGSAASIPLSVFRSFLQLQFLFFIVSKVFRLFFTLFIKNKELLPAILRSQQDIHEHKSLSESLLVLAIFVILVFLQFFGEVALDVFGNFWA